MDRGEKVLLIDVREPWEFEICRIDGAKLLPMGLDSCEPD
jgi:sulfur-carrier protein adenylyltransferase/sulfurtransferase